MNLQLVVFVLVALVAVGLSGLARAAAVEEVLKRLVGSEPVPPEEAKRLLTELASDPDQKELNAKRLLEACNFSEDKCGSSWTNKDLFSDHLHLSASLKPYLIHCNQGQIDLCRRTFASRLQRTIDGLEPQKKTDVSGFASRVALPRDFDALHRFNQVPQSNLIEAVLDFVESEVATSKPASERRYFAYSAFEDMADVLLAACQEVVHEFDQFFPPAVASDTELSPDQSQWLSYADLCTMIPDKTSNVISFASFEWHQRHGSRV